MFVNYNFQSIKQEDFHLNHLNRSFMYGDSVFETILIRDSQIRFLSDHIQRLKKGLDILGIHPVEELSVALLENHIMALAKANQLETNARVKIQVWRKSGGLLIPEKEEGDMLITVNPPGKSQPSVKEKVIIYDGIRLSYTPFSGNKTGNMLPYILAGKYLKHSGMDDLVLLNHELFVTECVYTNLFWIKDNTVFTPSLNCGCIAGIMRKQIIAWFAQNNISFEEGQFLKVELLNADAVFTSNVSGISAVKNLEGKNMDISHRIITELQQVFQ
jgi:branched-subunit amino acid aminotransferase/4-amino-4-deoxychorismate lyase